MRTAWADAWEGSRRPAGSGAAHSPQNFAVGAFSKPHLLQRRPNGAAHSLQNLSPSGLSVPHFEQRIGSPRSRLLKPLVSPGVRNDRVKSPTLSRFRLAFSNN